MALAESGPRRKLGWGAAVLVIVAANFPDVDVSFGLAGRDSLVFLRRGITHSVGGIAAGSLLLGWLFRRWLPGTGMATLVSLALLGYASHVVMDAVSTWGPQLLSPFSRYRLSPGWVGTVSPATWLILGAGLAAGVALKRWSVVANRTAIGILIVWYVLCGAANTMARAQFSEALKRITVSVDRVDAFPHGAGPMEWNVVAVASDRYYQAYIHIVNGIRGRVGVFFRQPVPERLSGAFSRDYEIWASAPLVRPIAVGGAGALALCDLRFLGRTEGMPFVAKIERDSSGRVRHEWLPWHVTEPEPDQEYELPKGPGGG